MSTQLKQISVRGELDWLTVHSTAVNLGKLGGMSPSEQVDFADKVVMHFAGTATPDTISFSSATEDGHNILIASSDHNTGSLKRELPFHSNTTPSTSNLENIAQSFPLLLQRLADIEQFSFAMSHELKSALTRLKLSIALMEKEVLSSSARKLLTSIRGSSIYLDDTLRKLNEVNEVDNRGSKVVKRLNIKTVFEKSLSQYEDQLHQTAANVSVDFTNVVDFNYVEIYLSTIFSNVLSNAIKYSHADRPLQLIIIAQQNDCTLVLSVIDNGIGIDLPKHGNHLFHPFSRFDHKSAGSGIGLYLIKSMIEKNGGSVEVESEPGKGTTFRFYLREYPEPVFQSTGN